MYIFSPKFAQVFWLVFSLKIPMQVTLSMLSKTLIFTAFRKYAFKNHEDFSQVIMRPRQR